MLPLLTVCLSTRSDTELGEPNIHHGTPFLSEEGGGGSQRERTAVGLFEVKRRSILLTNYKKTGLSNYRVGGGPNTRDKVKSSPQYKYTIVSLQAKDAQETSHEQRSRRRMYFRTRGCIFAPERFMRHVRQVTAVCQLVWALRQRHDVRGTITADTKIIASLHVSRKGVPCLLEITCYTRGRYTGSSTHRGLKQPRF